MGKWSDCYFSNFCVEYETYWRHINNPPTKEDLLLLMSFFCTNHFVYRAADSQRRMEEMMVKYEEMKHKLEWTRVTLAETHQRLEKHNNSRSERLRQSVEQLKVRTTETQQKLFERNHRGSPANQGTEGGSQIRQVWWPCSMVKADKFSPATYRRFGCSVLSR